MTVDQLASMSEIQTMANQVVTVNVTGDVSLYNTCISRLSSCGAFWVHLYDFLAFLGSRVTD